MILKAWATVAALALVVAGCSGNLGAPEAVTKQGDEFTTLWKGFLVTAGVIGLIVYGLIIYAALRFRRRKGDERGLEAEAGGERAAQIGFHAAPTSFLAEDQRRGRLGHADAERGTGSGSGGTAARRQDQGQAARQQELPRTVFHG